MARTADRQISWSGPIGQLRLYAAFWPIGAKYGPPGDDNPPAHFAPVFCRTRSVPPPPGAGVVGLIGGLADCASCAVRRIGGRFVLLPTLRLHPDTQLRRSVSRLDLASNSRFLRRP